MEVLQDRLLDAFFTAHDEDGSLEERIRVARRFEHKLL